MLCHRFLCCFRTFIGMPGAEVCLCWTELFQQLFVMVELLPNERRHWPASPRVSRTASLAEPSLEVTVFSPQHDYLQTKRRRSANGSSTQKKMGFAPSASPVRGVVSSILEKQDGWRSPASAGSGWKASEPENLIYRPKSIGDKRLRGAGFTPSSVN